jgi:hypothetical protein
MMKLQRIQNMSLAAALALGIAVLDLGSAALADEHHHVVVAPDVTFNPGPPTLPAGAQVAVLLGSPAKEGPFVIRLKFPAGYVIPPHRHSKEEHVTVISGGFGMASGEKFDAAAPVLPAGSFVQIPVGQAHFAWTEEGAVVQINGMGPFDIEYVDSKDDPRTN